MTPEQIATIGQHLAGISLSQRASRAAWAILGRRAAGLVVRPGDVAEAIGWTKHNAARAVRELDEQAPGILAPREGYKPALRFAIEDEPTTTAQELGPKPAPNIGTDTGPNSEMGPIQAPNIGTDTGPNSEIGAAAGPENSPTLVSLIDMRGGGKNYRAGEPQQEVQQDSQQPTAATLPNLTQAEATQTPDVITVGGTRDRLAKLGFTLAALTNPSTVQLIQKWRSWGTTTAQLETAIATAHEANGGQRPTSPAYYQWAVTNVIQADAEAAKDPEPSAPPAATSQPGKGTRKPKHNKGTVSHDNLHGKDYSAGTTEPGALPDFLR